jgi:hypothetical protein
MANPMMEQYLRNQQHALRKAPSETSSIYGGNSKMIEQPDNQSLEEFRHQVKLWIEVDNQIKGLQQTMKEKKNVQKVLAEQILQFMGRYNIEDLNAKDCKLRYKVSYVKPPVKPTNVKQKLLNYFEHDKDTADKVVKAVFDDNTNEKIEKVSLKRLKGVRIMNL